MIKNQMKISFCQKPCKYYSNAYRNGLMPFPDKYSKDNVISDDSFAMSQDILLHIRHHKELEKAWEFGINIHWPK